MVGTATDPLSAPSHVTLEQKQADEIVALATIGVGLRIAYGSGLWYSQDIISTSNSNFGTGALILSRFDFPPGTTIVELNEYIVTAAGAGGLRRLCIYNDNGASYPGSLLKDAGTYSTEITGAFGGPAAFTAVNVSGVKWIGGVSTVSACSPATNAMSCRAIGLTTLTAGNASWAGYIQTGVAGALPDPFTTTRANNTHAPRVFFKTG
jgi:hypothetical protein